MPWFVLKSVLHELFSSIEKYKWVEGRKSSKNCLKKKSTLFKKAKCASSCYNLCVLEYEGVSLVLY